MMVSVEKECRQTLFSTQYVKIGFTSGVRGDLSRVFMCRRCDGTIQEADLMVDGETYGYVMSFGRHA